MVIKIILLNLIQSFIFILILSKNIILNYLKNYLKINMIIDFIKIK